MNLLKTNKIPNLKQIMTRIRDYSNNIPPYCKAFSISDDVRNWLCILQGPNNSPYQHSVLFLKMCFETSYPDKPPKFLFISPTYHPNIRLNGEVCHPILSEDYHRNVSLRQIIDCIYELLYSPICSYPVRSNVLQCM